MIHIAIVEDDPEVREQLVGYVRRYERQFGKMFELTVFADGDEIVSDYRAVYDIILLDIQMRRMDGMAAAEAIRKVDKDVILIFITNMAQFAIEGYEVDAMDFILKPVSYYRLAAALTKAKKRLQAETGVRLVLHSKDGTYYLDSARVHYIEILNHHTIFHTEDGRYDSTGSLKKLEEQLQGQSFARCNNCYLVNLHFVAAVEGSDVVVGRDRLQISRTRRKQFLQKMSEYFGGQ